MRRHQGYDIYRQAGGRGAIELLMLTTIRQIMLQKWNDILKEVRCIKELSNEHIVKWKGCYIKDQAVWLIMEYCVGSAADILEGAFSSRRAISIARECSDATTVERVGNRCHLRRHSSRLAISSRQEQNTSRCEGGKHSIDRRRCRQARCV